MERTLEKTAFFLGAEGETLWRRLLFSIGNVFVSNGIVVRFNDVNLAITPNSDPLLAVQMAEFIDKNRGYFGEVHLEWGSRVTVENALIGANWILFLVSEESDEVDAVARASVRLRTLVRAITAVSGRSIRVILLVESSDRIGGVVTSMKDLAALYRSQGLPICVAEITVQDAKRNEIGEAIFELFSSQKTFPPTVSLP